MKFHRTSRGKTDMQILSPHFGSQADVSCLLQVGRLCLLSPSLPFLIFSQSDWLILRVNNRLISASILSYTSLLEWFIAHQFVFGYYCAVFSSLENSVAYLFLSLRLYFSAWMGSLLGRCEPSGLNIHMFHGTFACFPS